MIAAAIDIGTNSIKLVVGRKDRSGIRLLHEDVLITRLGENLDSPRRIQPDAARRTLDGLIKLIDDARRLGAVDIRAVATAAMRDAGNSSEFIAAVEAQTGVRVEVISGDEEARLTRNAVVLDPVLGRYEGEQVTVDVGGGSTEITTSVTNTSIDLGAVRLHERFIKHDPPSVDEVQSAAAFAENALRPALPELGDIRFVGMGGTAVNLARIIRGVPCEGYLRVHGEVLSAQEIGGMIDRLAAMKIEQRRGIIGLDPERADVILAGAIILAAVLRVSGKDEVTISVRGLRHGLLYEMLEVSQ